MGHILVEEEKAYEVPSKLKWNTDSPILRSSFKGKQNVFSDKGITTIQFYFRSPELLSFCMQGVYLLFSQFILQVQGSRPFRESIINGLLYWKCSLMLVEESSCSGYKWTKRLSFRLGDSKTTALNQFRYVYRTKCRKGRKIFTSLVSMGNCNEFVPLFEQNDSFSEGNARDDSICKRNFWADLESISNASQSYSRSYWFASSMFEFLRYIQRLLLCLKLLHHYVRTD